MFKEIGLVNGKNSWILNFDMKNVPINDIYKGLPKFNYIPKEDKWGEYLAKGKSTYLKELTKQVKVQCIKRYFDEEFKEIKDYGDAPYKASLSRARMLEDIGVARII